MGDGPRDSGCSLTLSVVSFLVLAGATSRGSDGLDIWDGGEWCVSMPDSVMVAAPSQWN